jgi:hypothetical protein
MVVNAHSRFDRRAALAVKSRGCPEEASDLASRYLLFRRSRRRVH